jgi:hypothetical protein
LALEEEIEISLQMYFNSKVPHNKLVIDNLNTKRTVNLFSHSHVTRGYVNIYILYIELRTSDTNKMHHSLSFICSFSCARASLPPDILCCNTCGVLACGYTHRAPRC